MVPENNARFMVPFIKLIIRNLLLGFINQLTYQFEELISGFNPVFLFSENYTI